jgi:hypothetical protein
LYRYSAAAAAAAKEAERGEHSGGGGGGGGVSSGASASAYEPLPLTVTKWDLSRMAPLADAVCVVGLGCTTQIQLPHSFCESAWLQPSRL